MPWAEINGIRMYYESHGEGDPIAFAHGAGGNHLSWWQQVAHFRHKYRCVTFDHRGFGRTTDAEGGPGVAAFPEDLRLLMDHVEIERAYLVAQSMGGGTCLGFTVAYPGRVKGLVMADTTGTIRDEKLEQMRQLHRDSQGEPVTLRSRAYNPELREKRPHLAFLYDSIMALNPPRADQTREREERHVATPEKLAQLDVPVQFIVGEKDAIVSPDIITYAASLVPGARCAVVPGSGHSVYFEDAPAFNRILEEFFESHQAKG